MRLVALALALVTVGCQKRVPEEIVVEVRDVGRGVANVRIEVDGRVRGVTDARGVARFASEGRRVLRVAFAPLDPDSPFLPQVHVWHLEERFFPEEVARRSLELSRVPEAAEERVVSAERSQWEDVPRVSRALRESSLPPEPAAPIPTPRAMPTAAPLVMKTPVPLLSEPTPQAWPILTPLPAMAALPTPVPAPRPAVAKPAPTTEMARSEIRVRAGQGPLAGAQILALHSATRVPRLVGSTGADGSFQHGEPRILKPEAFLVRHDCCRAQIVPAGAKVEVELSPGPGAEFVVQSDAYGVARALPGTEVLGSRGRIEVAGPQGIATVAGAALGGDAFELRNKDALPERFVGKISGSRAVIRYAGLKRAPLPAVGWWERGEAEAPAWRKLRRELFARFVQSTAMRAVVPQELERLGAAVGLPPEAFAKRGWEFTTLNAELDFLLKVAFEPEAGKVRVALFDRAGRTVHENEKSIGERPEQVGALLHEELVSRFPFEGSVVRTEGNGGVVNLGHRHHRLAVGDQLEVFQWPDGDRARPPRESLGWARVSAVSDDEATVEGLNLAVGMRVRRRTGAVLASSATPGGM